MQCYCEIDWDKLPDWIQAFGAMIAAVGLVITLLLQRKTLKEQQKITRLEFQKYINNYLPILEVSNIIYTKAEQARNIKFDVTIKVNSLQSLTINHNFPESYTVKIPYYISDVILPKEYVFNLEIQFVLSNVFIEIEEYTGNTIFFNFQDALGNKYEQHLVYKGSNKLFLHPAFRK